MLHREVDRQEGRARATCCLLTRLRRFNGPIDIGATAQVAMAARKVRVPQASFSKAVCHSFGDARATHNRIRAAAASCDVTGLPV